MFVNDYSELAHKNILDALSKYSSETNVCYGLDYHSKNAANYIKKTFDCKNADIHFLSGGTQTNLTVISYILKDYEGVIACSSGHINVHETASIESTGHKIYQVKGNFGKVTPKDILEALNVNNNEHMVSLKMVYISNSTEIGSIYTKNELQELYKCCKDKGLYLFLDGARLGVALTCKASDLTPADIAKYTDIFYIGGNKNGLIGEALVIVNDELKPNFRYQIKNKGAMLAKGYMLGIAFEEAFKDNLYFEIAKQTNKMAVILNNKLQTLGYSLLDSPTNQQFVTMPKEKALKVIDKYGVELWEELGNNLMIRFVTSFKTTEEDINELIAYLETL